MKISNTLLESISKQVHEQWMLTRLQQGWRWGEKRNDELKLHPCLVPYDFLSEEEKDVDRATVQQVLSSLFSMNLELVDLWGRRYTCLEQEKLTE